MSNIILKVENLSKRYRIGVKDEIHDSLMGKIISWFLSPLTNFRRVQKLSKFNNDDSQDIIWAIKNISFEVNNGEILGIIGKNGAGKSTLLKILSRIVEPTRGQATVNGRVASLLEIGTGFHQELSGRENIYLNGTILGMTKAEINKNFDAIVEFSEVGKFIDTPVKRYSSGMYVRLAFAVAAHLNPEILIVDEVLAVGDAAFQKKCLGKMSETAKTGRTVIFVSHNMHTIQSLCTRTILLDGGKIIKDGNTNEVVSSYLKPIQEHTIEGESDLRNWPGSRKSPGKIRATYLRTLDKNGNTCSTYDIYDPITFELEIENISKNGFVVSFLVNDTQGTLVYQVRSQDSPIDTEHVPSSVTVQMTIPELKIVEKQYTVDVWVGNHFDKMEDLLENAISFDVINIAHSKLALRSVIHETGQWKLV
ncbi:MAG: ATP-binding cassette domain-containing protein [Planctomycetia bacterium]|nr:ATP-binding cassette domain-containing protein [Planctomycetia bacterium]